MLKVTIFRPDGSRVGSFYTRKVETIPEKVYSRIRIGLQLPVGTVLECNDAKYTISSLDPFQIEGLAVPPSLSGFKQAGPSDIGAAAQTKGEDWGMVFVSGVVSGVAMAVSRAHLSGLMWLLRTGLVYALTITTGPFRFNWIQKLVGTAMMFFIGMYWVEILEWFYPKKH